MCICTCIYLYLYLFVFVRSKAGAVPATARCVPVVNIMKRKFYIRFETFSQIKLVKIDHDVIETATHTVNNNKSFAIICKPKLKYSILTFTTTAGDLIQFGFRFFKTLILSSKLDEKVSQKYLSRKHITQMQSIVIIPCYICISTNTNTNTHHSKMAKWRRQEPSGTPIGTLYSL